MTSRRATMGALLLLAATGLVATSAGQPPGHHHGGGAAGASGGGPRGSEEHRSAEACAVEFDAVVAEGRGFGMAFAADQNGYPGPMHVLELKDRLRLTAEQETRAQGLTQAMFAESRPKSTRLLEAEARLRRLFADRVADEASVRAAVADAEQARRDVRLVHLLFHLRTRALLTEAQVAAYHEARWGAR